MTPEEIIPEVTVPSVEASVSEHPRLVLSLKMMSQNPETARGAGKRIVKPPKKYETQP